MSRIDILAPVEVVSFSNERPRPKPAQPTVAAGGSWGGRAVFDFSAQPNDDAGPEIVDGGDGGGDGSGGGGGFGGANWANQEKVIRGVEQFREVSLSEVQAGDIALEVEGIRSVTFFLGVRKIVHEDRKVRGGVTFVQPTIEYVSEYLRLVFPFATALERGEPAPPKSPELPDLDARYGN